MVALRFCMVADVLCIWLGFSAVVAQVLVYEYQNLGLFRMPIMVYRIQQNKRHIIINIYN